MNCPECDKPMVCCEYDYTSPEHYDGVSEFQCAEGHPVIRIGRWTGRRLGPDEIEPRFGGRP